MSSASIFVFWRINSLIASKTANSDRMDSRHIANSQRIEMPWYSILGSWRSDVQLRYVAVSKGPNHPHLSRWEFLQLEHNPGAWRCHIQGIPQLRSIAQLPQSSQGGRFLIRVPAAERQCIWKYLKYCTRLQNFPPPYAQKAGFSVFELPQWQCTILIHTHRIHVCYIW